MSREESFIDAVEDLYMDTSVHFYGIYNGRFGHKGLAVTIDALSELYDIGLTFGAYSDLEDLPSPIIDQLGLSYIVSWPLRYFTNTDKIISNFEQ